MNENNISLIHLHSRTSSLQDNITHTPCELHDFQDDLFVRRSVRNPEVGSLERRDVKDLIYKIKNDSKGSIILKIKDHIQSDISPIVLDEIIEALSLNNVCQALYIQNLSSAMSDKQLKALIEVFKSKKIWCLNIGENYKISQNGWNYFCKTLPLTSITHLYVSEHVIQLELKNDMRSHIRENRKKHDLHNSISNLKVIEKCTNMWWNPINFFRHQLDPKFQSKKPDIPARKHKSSKHKTKAPPKIKKEKAPPPPPVPLGPLVLTPRHTAYWAEGYGKGGEKPWKFSCLCGETCSSYENWRYHPTGRMYECTQCSLWSHVKCVIGDITEDDLEELDEALCNACKSRLRREKLALMKSMNITWKDGNVVRSGEDDSFNSNSLVLEEKEEMIEENINLNANLQECDHPKLSSSSSSASKKHARIELEDENINPKLPHIQIDSEKSINNYNSVQNIVVEEVLNSVQPIGDRNLSVFNSICSHESDQEN
jgi:hypothetical protein